MWRWWSRCRKEPQGSPRRLRLARLAIARRCRAEGAIEAAAGQTSGGEGAGAGGGIPSLRIAEGNGAEGPATAEAQPEEADTSTSANNSFLLGGGMGDAATPGGGFGGRGWSRRRRNGGLWRRRWRSRWSQRRESLWRWEVDQVLVVPAVGAGSAEVGGGFGGGGGGGGGARGWSRNRAAVNRIRGNFMDQYTNSGFDAHPYPLNVAESPRIPSYQ